MFKHLAKKTALVTGSTSGIGLAVAQRFAGHGCNVVLNGFGDKSQIKTLVDDMTKKYKVQVQYSGADLKHEQQIFDMVEQANKTFGGVDILVNNAGIQHISRAEDFETQKFKDVIDINLSSAFYSMRQVLPHMLDQKWGRIINIASVHGLVASKNKCAYVAAKHGMVGLTKAVALENADRGVTANCVCPGWVRTELIERQIELRAQEQNVSIDEAARSLLTEKQPSLTFVTPTQLADTVVFLATDAASQITGTSIPVDGGWTAQ